MKLANNNNDLTVTMKAIFDKSNMEDFKSEVTKAVEDATKSSKTVEIKANTQPARNSMQKFTSYLSKLSNANDGFTTLKIKANTKEAEKAINDLQAKLKELKVSFDMSKLGNQINVALKKAKSIDNKIKISASIDGGQDVISQLKAIQSLLRKIQKDSNINIKAKIDTTSVKSEIDKVNNQKKIETKNAGTTDKKIKEASSDIGSEINKPKIDVAKTTQAVSAVTQQFNRLRSEALKAGNELNKATDPKEIERLTTSLNEAIKKLVDYKRATSGLTKAQEGILVEKLAVGSIKEKTRAYQVLVDWIKKAVQEQRTLDVETGKRNPPKGKDTSLSDWFKNLDIGQMLANTAYAARGNLNFIQSFGGLVSSLSQVSGVVSVFAKALGGVAIAGLAAYGAVNAVVNAFSFLADTLQQIGQTIYNILKPGIDLYRTRQSAELSIAAAVSGRATEKGQPISFERGMEISSKLMEQVVADAARSAFNPQELIDALRGTLPLAFGKGLTLEQAYELTKGVASVAKVTNLASNQVLQEMRDLLQGTPSARSSQVAGAIGVTGAELREAQAQGQLYEYLTEKLKSFTVALDRYSTTLSGTLDRMQETYAIMAEKAFEPIAPIVTSFLNYFTDKYIGGFIDKATGERLIKSEDFYTVDENGNKQAKEIEAVAPEGFDWVTALSEALKDLAQFTAPIIDELIEFIQELTGKEDVVQAVLDIVKLLIRSFATLGEFILSVTYDMLKVMKDFEAPISIIISLFIQLGRAIGAVSRIMGVGGYLGILSDVYDFIVSFVKGVTALLSGDIKGVQAGASGMKNAFNSSVEHWTTPQEAFEDFANGFNISKTYSGLLGKLDNTSKSLGAVTKLVAEAIENPASKPEGKKVKYSDIQGNEIKEDAKEALKENKRMLQELIEGIKQALKQALAELKDISEQNELAYKQGYKSVEDYFTQKAQLEAEEARLKLDAAQRERDAIASLDTGGDASAEYQKNRDLIRYNSEIALYTREYNKKMAQQTELLGSINNTLSNKIYKTGIVVSGGSDIGNKVAQEAVERLGLPTEYGGDGEVSFDCSSLTMKVNSEAGIEIPRTADEQKRQHDEMQTFHDLQEVIDGMYIPKPGDSVYFRAGDTEDSYDGIGHVEIVKAFRDGILETISGGNYGEGVLEKERELGDYEMAGFGSVEELAQKLNVLSTEAKEATVEVNEVVGQMPQAFHSLVEAYQSVIKQGQKQMIEVQKEYASQLNEPDLLKEISLAEIEADMKERIGIARNKFANIPAIADNLEKLLPIKKIDAIISSMVTNIESRMKILEHDAKSRNLDLQNKILLFPQAIERYFSHFFDNKTKFSIGAQIQELMNQADEYSKLGLTGKFQETMNKVKELQDKLVGMINSWLDEMSEYFNYRRSLIDADSGLTSFVKEDAKKELDKGEARVKAQAYRSEADSLKKRELELEKKVNEEKAKGVDIDGTANNVALQHIRSLREKAERQAEINEKLGEQKTLWQETMDAANQALENGLYNFMTDYINTAESIGEAFRNMAVDILKDLQKFFAKKAITDLMYTITGQPNLEYTAPNSAEIQTSINTGQMTAWLQNIYRVLLTMLSSQQSSVFSNVGSSVAGVLTSGGKDSIASRILNGHATGGYISGPGTGTSDSIPAMLSNGEYVIKAEAVKRYGTNFLNAVNSGAFTRMKTSIPRFAEGGYVGDALQDTARGMTDFAKSIGTSVSTTNNMNVALVRNEQEAYEHFMRSPQGQKILVDFQKGNGRVFARFNS